MNNTSNIKIISDKIIDFLKDKGFVIQRYDAYKTDSVYLKLDYGVCNTIRISDHQGKQHLCYRYNLIFGGNVNITEEKYMRFYFNEDTVKELIMQILIDKKIKEDKYGKKGYRNFMIKNKNDKQHQKGFWSQAKLVTDDI